MKRCIEWLAHLNDWMQKKKCLICSKNSTSDFSAWKRLYSMQHIRWSCKGDRKFFHLRGIIQNIHIQNLNCLVLSDTSCLVSDVIVFCGIDNLAESCNTSVMYEGRSKSCSPSPQFWICRIPLNFVFTDIKLEKLYQISKR